jgi:hypothetical protein
MWHNRAGTTLSLSSMTTLSVARTGGISPLPVSNALKIPVNSDTLVLVFVANASQLTTYVLMAQLLWASFSAATTGATPRPTPLPSTTASAPNKFNVNL